MYARAFPEGRAAIAKRAVISVNDDDRAAVGWNGGLGLRLIHSGIATHGWPQPRLQQRRLARLPTESTLPASEFHTIKAIRDSWQGSGQGSGYAAFLQPRRGEIS
jgi:hypothetical protein